MDLEHVQPVQSLTPDARSRARTVVAASVPVVLLVVIVAAAWYAPGSADPAGPRTTNGPPRAAIANESPTALEPPDRAGLVAAGFPGRALGLPVHSVAETLELRAGGELADQVVAVAGWLTVPPEPGCGVDQVIVTGGLIGAGTDCRRETILTGDAEPVLAVEGAGLATLRTADAELHPQALPGISLASIAAGQRPDGDEPIRPAQAVVLGRFADTRLDACIASSADCATTFALERVIWVDGDWRLRRPEQYPAPLEASVSGTVRWPIIDRAVQRGAIILSEVIVPRRDLVRLDPTADRAVDPAADGTVWYVRALLRPDGIRSPRGDVGWAVIEDATGVVLASEPDRRSASAGD
jgi:hypothetical protein